MTNNVLTPFSNLFCQAFICLVSSGSGATCEIAKSPGLFGNYPAVVVYDVPISLRGFLVSSNFLMDEMGMDLTSYLDLLNRKSIIKNYG